MQRLWAWASGVALALLGSQIALEIFKQVAERIGLYDRPREAADTVLNFFLSLAELPWLRTTTLVLCAFVAGLWLDWLLRKFDGSRAKALQPQAYLCFHQSQAGGVMDTRRSNAPQRRHALSQTRRYAPQQWAFCGGEAGSLTSQRAFR